MSRLASLHRRNMILGGLIIVLVAILLLRPSTGGTRDEESLPLAFPAFDAEKAHTIELFQAATDWSPAIDLKIAKKAADGAWVVKSQFDYPMPPGKQDRLLGALAEMRVRKLVTTRAPTFPEYAGNAGFITIRVTDAAGNELAELDLGKSEYPDHFVRLGTDDDARMVLATKLSREMANGELSRWVEPRIFPQLAGDSVVRVELEQPAFQRKVAVVKKGLDPRITGTKNVPPPGANDSKEAWWMVAPAVQDANSDRVNDLARTFTGLRLSGIASGGSMTAEEKKLAGFDEPQAIVMVWHFASTGGTRHRMEIGATSEDGQTTYVRIDGTPYIFEVADYQLADFRRTPEEFKAVPPEPPPAPAAAGSPDGDDEGTPDGDGPPLPLPPAPDPDKDK